MKIIRQKPLEGIVLGVAVKHEKKRLFFKAKKAVLLASGGFGANLQMVIDHDRRLSNTRHDNWPGATGECIKMAQDIGAEVVGMDYIQCFPIKTRQGSKGMFFMITSQESKPFIDENYHIFINHEGDRFVNEDGRRSDIQYAACVQKTFKAYPPIKANTIEELEKSLKIPKGNLVKTIQKYNSFCDTKNDLDFNKNYTTLLPCRTPPFQGDTMTMMRHHTMGGLKISSVTGSVLDRWGKIIPHLYAIGEITGGIHGTNRLGYNAIPECIIFGRTVGHFIAQKTT
jgi:succinate dehydrogenase/fumarate reductase flavoprotein subunit